MHLNSKYIYNNTEPDDLFIAKNNIITSEKSVANVVNEE